MQSLLRSRAVGAISLPSFTGLSTFLIALFVASVRAVANVPENPSPADGATKQAITAGISCDGVGGPVGYDVYWGTDPNPPIVAINMASNLYSGGVWWSPGLHGYTQAYSTTYYWRVAVHTQSPPEITSPVWSYTIKAVNEPPNPPFLISPGDGAAGLPVNPTLSYYLTDFEGSQVNHDVYLGTDPNPPLIASHVIADSYKVPFVLSTSTVYYWRLVLRDTGGLETIGPTWTFTTASTSNRIPSVPSNPQPWYLNPPQSTVNLSWECTDPDGEPLTFNVYFSSQYPYPKNPLPLVGTTTDHHFQVNLSNNSRYYWTVEVKDSYWTVKPEHFWQFDNGGVPVLFSRFDARQSGANVEVRWQLQSDEAMESYTLFRKKGKAEAPIAIASAPVNGIEGSYLDTSVQAGTTYQYELLVTTKDGDEFRSPAVMVSLPALALTLHQNVPNPFNPLTTIRYDLAAGAHVRLSIIDVAGKRVRTLVDEQQSAGSRSAIWNGRDDSDRAVASGVYFYVLDAGKERLTRKLVLLK